MQVWGKVVLVAILLSVGFWGFKNTQPIKDYFFNLFAPDQRLVEEKKVIGSTDILNPRVREIQEILLNLKYDPGNIDGRMGERTRKAIKKFQKSSALQPTGMVDDKTLVELQRRSNAIKPTIHNTLRDDSHENEKSFHSREMIEEAQSMLKELGFYNGRIDGIAGKKTKEAIKRFQKTNNLKADGIMNQATWKKLKT